MVDYRYGLVPYEWAAGDSPRPSWRVPGGLPGIDLGRMGDMSVPGAALGATRGMAFAWTPGVLPSGAVSLGRGDFRDITVDAAMRDAWKSGTGYKPDGARLVDLLWDQLTTGADPSGQDAARPLVPTRSLDLELWLPGHSMVRRERFAWGSHGHTNKLKAALTSHLERIRDDAGRGKLVNPITRQPDTEYHREVMQGLLEKYRCTFDDLRPSGWPKSDTPKKHNTTLTESFDTSNSDTLGPDQTWTEVDGDWDIVSNAAQLQTTAGTVRTARCEADLSSDDHYAESVGNAGTVSEIGAAVRFLSSAETAYIGFIYTPNSTVYLFKLVAGAETSISSQASSWGGSGTFKCQADGSTIKVYQDGVQKISVTDTSITGNLRTGMMAYCNGTPLPNITSWSAADLYAAATVIPVFMNQYRQRHN